MAAFWVMAHGLECACVCQLDGIRFGFITCYDVSFNEQIEIIAWQKPDLVLIPGFPVMEAGRFL